jgi:hypothetical protein
VQVLVLRSVKRKGSEARAGFEPAHDGFANRCLSQLGDRAESKLAESSDLVTLARLQQRGFIASRP